MNNNLRFAIWMTVGIFFIAPCLFGSVALVPILIIQGYWWAIPVAPLLFFAVIVGAAKLMDWLQFQ